MDSEKHSSNELAEDRTRLAAVRTRMAADRTLMGWVRTGMSMITFGFTLYKVLQSLQEDGMALRTDQTPRNLGLFLVAVGTLSMIFGKIEYWSTLDSMREHHPFRLFRPSFVMALLLSLLGLALFVGILRRMV